MAANRSVIFIVLAGACAACLEPSVLGRDPLAVADAAAEDVRDARTPNDGCASCDARPDADVLPADGAVPCFTNLSLEGTAQVSAPANLQNLLGVTFSANPWLWCSNGTTMSMPSIVSDSVVDPFTGAAFPPARDGATYAALREGEGIDQGICNLWMGGSTQLALRFSAYLWQSGSTLVEPAPLALQIWTDYGFISGSCSQITPVGGLVPLTGSGWTDYCATVNWDAADFALGLSVTGSGANSSTLYVLVDDLRLGAACP